MTNTNSSGAQYLVRTADGLDYARVEPWEGGQAAAESGARRIGGYVVALDEYLSTRIDPVTGGDVIVADYRPGAAVEANETGRTHGAAAANYGQAYEGNGRGDDEARLDEAVLPQRFDAEPLRSEYRSGWLAGWHEHFDADEASDEADLDELSRLIGGNPWDTNTKGGK